MTEITEDILKKVIKKRASDSYKGKYGRVLLIGGSDNYGGAIIMSTEGAINAGAGLVATATHPMNLSALHARLPEAMFIDWRDSNYDVKEYDNGCLVLEPRELVKPKDVSNKALEVMDESIANFEKGKVSAPVDLSDF